LPVVAARPIALRAGERVAGVLQLLDVGGEPVPLLGHALHRGVGVVVAGRVHTRQQFDDGAAGQSGCVQVLDEGDPLDLVVGVVPLPASAAGAAGAAGAGEQPLFLVVAQ